MWRAIILAAVVFILPSCSYHAAFTGPCDVLANASTPCVAAYSVTRRMFASYSGALFQIQRASDNATQDIGTLLNGKANTAAVTTFCNSTTCNFSKIYDQSGNANDLIPQSTSNQAPYGTYTFAGGTALPIITISCTSPCAINSASYKYSQNYTKRSGTTGIPTGSNSITVFEVRGNFQYASCCGDFGDMESTIHDDGAGTMFALVYTDSYASPAQIGVDHEDGESVYSTTVPSIYNVLAKHNSGSSQTAIKIADATRGSLSSLYSGADPVTFTLEGGISIGIGGDGTPALTNFLEGAIIANATSDSTDNNLQSNIAAFYGVQ